MGVWKDNRDSLLAAYRDWSPTDLLCQGIESRSLVELAGLSRNERGAAVLFEEALDELGCGTMEPTEALKRYAKAVSTSILASEIPPLEGAKRIWRATLYVRAHGWHDFDPFVYAATEADSRPEDREFFERAITKKPGGGLALNSEEYGQARCGVSEHPLPGRG